MKRLTLKPGMVVYIWPRVLAQIIEVKPEGVYVIYCDNQGRFREKCIDENKILGVVK